MEIEILTIGENAGRIWNLLDAVSEITISQLKSELNMEETSVYAAIGWLAREGKIFCRTDGGEMLLSNKPVQGFICFG